jgi:hypothetical protein
MLPHDDHTSCHRQDGPYDLEGVDLQRQHGAIGGRDAGVKATSQTGNTVEQEGQGPGRRPERQQTPLRCRPGPLLLSLRVRPALKLRPDTTAKAPVQRPVASAASSPWKRPAPRRRNRAHTTRVAATLSSPRVMAASGWPINRPSWPSSRSMPGQTFIHGPPSSMAKRAPYRA